jgi:hypothetical protein
MKRVKKQVVTRNTSAKPVLMWGEYYSDKEMPGRATYSHLEIMKNKRYTGNLPAPEKASRLFYNQLNLNTLTKPRQSTGYLKPEQLLC